MTEFDSYVIYYQSAPQYAWAARILLRAGGRQVATLMFMKPDQPVPANSVVGGTFRLHFRIDEMADIVGILRYEKPLYVHLVASNGIGTLATTDEPVGEQEG